MENSTREYTFAMLKPSCNLPAVIAQVELAIQKAGLSIEVRTKKTFSKNEAETFYAEHAGKPFFQGLVEMLSSSEVYCLKLSGVDAVKKWRDLIGPTNPAKGAAGQLRYEYANAVEYAAGSPDNGFHGSANAEDAARECKIVFGY